LLKENLESCQQSLKATHKRIQQTEESNKRLSMSLNQNVSKHNKSWCEYSAQYQQTQKSKLQKFTENDFFKPSQIELINTETNELLLVSQDGSIVRSEKQQPTYDNDAIAEQTLYVKEKYNISISGILNGSSTTTSLVCIKYNI